MSDEIKTYLSSQDKSDTNKEDIGAFIIKKNDSLQSIKAICKDLKIDYPEQNIRKIIADLPLKMWEDTQNTKNLTLILNPFIKAAVLEGISTYIALVNSQKHASQISSDLSKYYIKYIESFKAQDIYKIKLTKYDSDKKKELIFEEIVVTLAMLKNIGLIEIVKAIEKEKAVKNYGLFKNNDNWIKVEVLSIDKTQPATYNDLLEIITKISRDINVSILIFKKCNELKEDPEINNIINKLEGINIIEFLDKIIKNNDENNESKEVTTINK